jgi:ubiquitin fusion degradation protein 1
MLLVCCDAVILPTSALDELSRKNVQLPMMFQLTSATTSLSTHVGVIEFVANEGLCYVPHWVRYHVAVIEWQLAGVYAFCLRARRS